jgi:CheY-like chemotaxis protein
MQSGSSYVLVLSQQSDDLDILQSLLNRLCCAVSVASSEAQAVAQADQDPPYLVILSGDRRTWSQGLVRRLRTLNQAGNTTIVALTDCHAPSWLPQEENPGFDGFLVKPVSGDILSSLVQSARVRRSCLVKS